MTRNFRLLGIFRQGLLGMVLLLSACAHTPEVRSPRLLQAIDYNQHGEKAFRHEDYQLAIDNFQASLLINESVENIDGIAINRLSLSRSYQAIENLSEAHRFVDELLQDSVLHFSEQYMAAAAAQKSVLLLSQNELEEAAHWIDKAASFCGKCSLQGSILNLRSSVALRQNDAAAAVHWSELAVNENKPHSPLEYANSLRLLARARLLGNAAAGALPLLEEALALDKKTGTPEKIAYDMNVMADAYRSLGEEAKAREYDERARRVMEKFREAR